VDGQLVELEEQRPQLQAQAQVEALADSEVEYHEQLIEERETEIRGIETGIHELNEIFRDLGTIVHEQQSMLGMCLPAVSPPC
jgi:t-SNARE complex subunit (syntaxin)